MDPKVCISILNWRQPERTIDCIQSIYGQDYDAFEIVVVDNDSQDNSLSLIRKQFPDITILANPSNNGYAAGHQQVVDFALESPFELIWMLNNDLQVGRFALRKLVQCYLRHPRHLYGSLALSDGKMHQKTIWKIREGKIDFEETIDFDLLVNDYGEPKTDVTHIETASLSGSSMMIPMQIIREYGFISHDFFMYGEETDYCFRMAKQGITPIIVLSSHVDHFRKGSYAGNERIVRLMSYYRRRNYLYLMRKHRGYGFFLELQKTYFKEALQEWIRKKKVDRYLLRASLDAMAGRMGKVYAPEDYL